MAMQVAFSVKLEKTLLKRVSHGKPVPTSEALTKIQAKFKQNLTNITHYYLLHPYDTHQ